MDETREDHNNQETEVKCMNCGRNEHDAAVFPVRIKGSTTWVCAKCLPGLIHG